MNPNDRRARIVENENGRHLNLQDIKDALKDDAFVMQCAAVLAVGYQKGDPAVEVIRRTIGCAIFALSGDEAASKALKN